MARAKIIVPAIVGIAGVVLLVITLQNWYSTDQRYTVEKEKLSSDLNVAVNNLVDQCMQSLPNGSPSCINLKNQVTEACKLADSRLDACTDNRINTYYAEVSSNSSQSINSSSSVSFVSIQNNQSSSKSFDTLQLGNNNSIIAQEPKQNLTCASVMYNDTELNMVSTVPYTDKDPVIITVYDKVRCSSDAQNGLQFHPTWIDISDYHNIQKINDISQ